MQRKKINENLIKVSLLFALLLIFVFLPADTKAQGDSMDIVISYDSNYSKSDYVVESYCSLPDTDKYVIERDADKGLITIPCTGRKMKSLIFPKEQIQKVIKITNKEDLRNRTDFVFTSAFIYAVYTSTANAGIFIYSDVYVIPLRANETLYKSLFELPEADCIPAEIKDLFFRVLDFCKRKNIK